MARLKAPKGLNGVDGLVASVIAQATKDALRGKPAHKADALRYLRSTTYKSHLRMLSLPTDFMPVDQD
jgi:hypothetical protein